MDTAYGLADPEALRTLSGLDFLRAMIAGDLPAPPIAERLAFRLVEADPGRVLFQGAPDARLLNPLGTVHGGWALALIDSATGCAVHSILPAGTGYTTLETKANFTRAVRPDSGRLACEGRVVAAGRQVATAEARIVDGSGTVFAHGTSTLMIFGAR